MALMSETKGLKVGAIGKDVLQNSCVLHIIHEDTKASTTLTYYYFFNIHLLLQPVVDVIKLFLEEI